MATRETRERRVQVVNSELGAKTRRGMADVLRTALRRAGVREGDSQWTTDRATVADALSWLTGYRAERWDVNTLTEARERLVADSRDFG